MTTAHAGQVLYRRWRPPRFTDVVGQTPITQTLRQAVAGGRVAHAYLFCGPRGTGKTSTARVLAKAVNCLNRPAGTGDPCGTCAACAAIDRGTSMDIIEIDAASNRGIDEMRDLREKVRFAPAQAKYKVYIIDEAHALTSEAFNAFLKTLEEPPPTTLFILATTEPQKLPPTIVSRCQRFDFHRISTVDSVARLTEISAAEDIAVAPEVLRTIARAAGGSLRDATNLLEQLVTSYGARVTLDQVRELLGTGGEDRALALTKHLLAGNTAQALELVNQANAEGLDLRPLHRMTVDFLRAALLVKTGVKEGLDLSKEALTDVTFAASRVSNDHILRTLRVFGQVSLKHDQPSPLPLELAIVELGMEPEPVPRPTPPAPPRAATPASPTTSTPASVPSATRPTYPPPSRPAMSGSAQPNAPRPAPAAMSGPPGGVANGGAYRAPAPRPPPTPATHMDDRVASNWPTLLRALGKLRGKRFDIAGLLRSSTTRRITGDALVISFTHRSNGERLQEELDDPRIRLAVEDAVKQTYAGLVALRVETDDAPAAQSVRPIHQTSHLVRAAVNLGGKVAGEYQDDAGSAEN